MTLYEINEQLERILMLPDATDESAVAVNTETGEVFSAEDIEKMEMDREAKVKGCLLFCKNQDAEAAAIEAEVKKLQARAKACKARSERCANMVAQILGGEKFSCAEVTVKFSTSTSTPEEIDIDGVPEEYITIVPESRKVNKALLLKGLRELKKAGKEAKIGAVSLIEKVKMTYK